MTGGIGCRIERSEFAANTIGRHILVRKAESAFDLGFTDA
jgi:hypothetical protein